MGESKWTVAGTITGGVCHTKGSVGAGELDCDPVSAQRRGGGGGGLNDRNNTTQKVNRHS